MTWYELFLFLHIAAAIIWVGGGFFLLMLALRVLGTKDEVADLALFLCSDAAAYITGAIIPCDGGLCLQGAGRVGADR